VLAFIGDQRVTKEPSLVCLPTTKTWEWHSVNAITDFIAFDDHFIVEANRGTLWMPDAGNGAPGAIPVPHLLTIPNFLINLLRMQGPAITLHDVLLTVDGFILSGLYPPGPTMGLHLEVVPCGGPIWGQQEEQDFPGKHPHHHQ
jgi:hypothetical protein